MYVICHNLTIKKKQREGKGKGGGSCVGMCRVKSPMPWQHRTTGTQTYYIDQTNSREEGRKEGAGG
jgi:hypothetical protein